MRFLKENSYDIIRLYINQIGITIFSLVLYTSVSSLDKGLSLKLKIAISVFAILFFFALLYTVAWDWGANDKIRIDAGRMKKKRSKGAFLALLANLINFVLAGVCVISMALYMKGVSGALDILQIFNLILRLTNAMYLGVIQGIFASLQSNTELYNLLQSIAFLAAPLFAIAATHVGYIFGLKNIKIFPSSKKSNQKNK
jgi:hypothetical protein